MKGRGAAAFDSVQNCGTFIYIPWIAGQLGLHIDNMWRFVFQQIFNPRLFNNPCLDILSWKEINPLLVLKFLSKIKLLWLTMHSLFLHEAMWLHNLNPHMFKGAAFANLFFLKSSFSWIWVFCVINWYYKTAHSSLIYFFKFKGKITNLN